MVLAITDRIQRAKYALILFWRKCFFGTLLSKPITGWVDRRNQSMPFGRRGELAAERYLLRQGYWIIEHSFGEKVGEIDLVVSDGQKVIFVEVKSRTSDVAGSPAEAVDDEKQRHITQTARLFAVKNQLENSPMRFDTIAIVWPDLTRDPKITHIKNAFEATGNFQMF